MRYSNNRFILDVQEAQSQISIPVMKGDTGRTLYISLSDGGSPYIIEDGCYASMNIKRPDGTVNIDYCNIEKNSVIVYHFDEYSAAVEGIHNCQVILHGADNEVLATPRFTMLVNERVVPTDDINISDEEKNEIDQMIGREASRMAAEEVRSTNEAARIANEDTRIQAENRRVLAENEREVAKDATIEATNRATEAAERAEEATPLATSAASDATEAASVANEAADKASKAATSANTAAERAEEAVNFLEDDAIFTKINVYGDNKKEVKSISRGGTYTVKVSSACAICNPDGMVESVTMYIGNKNWVAYESEETVRIHAGLGGEDIEGVFTVIVCRRHDLDEGYDIRFRLVSDWMCSDGSYDMTAGEVVNFFNFPYKDQVSVSIYEAGLQYEVDFKDLIDDELSDTSELPVQNKVVKEAIDKVIEDAANNLPITTGDGENSIQHNLSEATAENAVATGNETGAFAPNSATFGTKTTTREDSAFAFGHNSVSLKDVVEQYNAEFGTKHNPYAISEGTALALWDYTGDEAMCFALARGKGSLVGGVGCIATKTGGVSIGWKNKSTEASAMAFGTRVFALAKHCFAAGNWLIASAFAQAVFGKYNKENPEAMFQVGCGSKNKRMNAFEACYNSTDGKYIMVGDTKITEAQLKKLLALLD